MGQINFVSDGESKPRKRNENNQEKKMEWSNPVPKVNATGMSFKVVDKKEDGKNREETQQKILTINKEASKKSFLSWFSGFKKSEDEKKKDKELLAEHKQDVLVEKKTRGQKTDYTVGENSSKNDAPLKSFLDKNRWKAARTLKTDLIKDEMTTFFDWRKNLTVLGISSALALLMLGFFYGGIIVWERKANEENRYKELEVEGLAAKIQGMTNDIKEIDRLREELKIVSALLDKHIYWTNFFTFLEDNTLKEVTYPDSFSGNTLGNYSFSAKADSFASMADQIRVMEENEYVNSVQVTKGDVASAKGETEDKGVFVGFSMALSLNPKIFFNQK